MGQATADVDASVELPDPSKTAPAAPLASADDLLAQLAGEEIDRLLAETDTDAPAINTPEHAVQPPVAQALPNAAASESEPASVGNAIEAAMRGVQASPAAAEAVAAPAKADLEATPLLAEKSTAQLLQEEMNEPPATLPSIAQVEDNSTANAEMQQLLNDSSPASASADEFDAGKPPPIYVKLLMLLNKPLEFLPESIRETMGKVAIITLFNALAVLLYVLLFRRTQ